MMLQIKGYFASPFKQVLKPSQAYKRRIGLFKENFSTKQGNFRKCETQFTNAQYTFLYQLSGKYSNRMRIRR